MKLHDEQQGQWSNRTGSTLLEVSISIAMVSIVLGVAAMVGIAGRKAFVTANKQAQLDSQLKIALDRISAELGSAISSSLDPQLTGMVTDTDEISLAQVLGIVDGVPVPSPDLISFSFEDDPNDPVGGLDNDNDGVVDEARVVFVRGSGGTSPSAITICKNVRRHLQGEEEGGGDENGNGLIDESGFLIQRDGNLLSIKITVQGTNANGESVTKTSSASIVLRN